MTPSSMVPGDQGHLWMEIPNLDQEMIHYVRFGAGLGSNDLGLGRGALRGSRIVKLPWCSWLEEG